MLFCHAQNKVYLESMVYLMLAGTIILTVAAQLLLTKGAVVFKDTSFSWAGLVGLVARFFQSGWLLAGILCFGLAFVLWVVVVAKIKLSAAYPISTALNLTLVVLGSALILREAVTGWQVLGVLLIVAGIFCILWK